MSEPSRLAIDHDFRHPRLLHQALTHRSFGTPHNERLEFVGDAVLGCVIALSLFERFPDLAEGKLSRARAHLVRQETLARLADRFCIGTMLRVGNLSAKGDAVHTDSMLADAMEAVFGAVFVDAGFDAARKVIEAAYDGLLRDADPATLGKDPKTHLQELLHKRQLAEPQYEIVAATGKAHARQFTVECRIASLAIATRGIGSSRQVAEQAAAAAALSAIPDTTAASGG